AMACGTPIIAFPSGALAEIVEHGVTGFLARDVDEMAEAIMRVDEISSETCRHIARERFSAERMTSEYLTRYEQLVHDSVEERCFTSTY
ncbi:MAG: glycosyltransferase, partial [Chloroflexi bacterium]|nr:glycosyltransferase [Chloroflexota bacterium]